MFRLKKIYIFLILSSSFLKKLLFVPELRVNISRWHFLDFLENI